MDDAVIRIARRAQEIYDTTLKNELEPEQSGKFVVVDVSSGKHYVADFAEDAIQNAREALPYGIFHLMRIGSPGAFKVSHIASSKAGPHSWSLR